MFLKYFLKIMLCLCLAHGSLAYSAPSGGTQRQFTLSTNMISIAVKMIFLILPVVDAALKILSSNGMSQGNGNSLNTGSENVCFDDTASDTYMCSSTEALQQADGVAAAFGN